MQDVNACRTVIVTRMTRIGANYADKNLYKRDLIRVTRPIRVIRDGGNNIAGYLIASTALIAWSTNCASGVSSGRAMSGWTPLPPIFGSRPGTHQCAAVTCRL